MSKKLYEDSNIQSIANAIRSKLGGNETYLTSEMAAAIGQIHGEPVLEALVANENGVYAPSTGKDGFSGVTVSVPASEPDLEELSVVQNGTYTPSTGKDGFSEVVVNVPSSGGGGEENLFLPYIFYKAGGNSPEITSNNGDPCLYRTGNFSWVICSSDPVPSSADRLDITLEASRYNTNYPRYIKVVKFEDPSINTYTDICTILDSTQTVESILAQSQIINLNLSENDQIQKQTISIDISNINESFYVGIYFDVVTTYLYDIKYYIPSSGSYEDHDFYPMGENFESTYTANTAKSGGYIFKNCLTQITIKGIRFWPRDNLCNVYLSKIDGTLLASKTNVSVVPEQWNDIYINEPIKIDTDDSTQYIVWGCNSSSTLAYNNSAKFTGIISYVSTKYSTLVDTLPTSNEGSSYTRYCIDLIASYAAPTLPSAAGEEF